MRKFLTLIMLFVSICMSAQTLKGDVNGNGKIDIDDVTMLISIYLDYEKPIAPAHCGHEYVDLALPSGIKWATCNVGASSPEEYGDYYAWGEIDAKSTYDSGTYKWCSETFSSMTKYWTYSSEMTYDNKIVLDLEDDVAHVKWGGDWRMPTIDELCEIRDDCIWTETTMNGINGYKVASKTNGNFIFLPFAGFRYNDELAAAGEVAKYWSCMLSNATPSEAAFLQLLSSSMTSDNLNLVNMSYDYRTYGLSVRAVCP